MSDTFNVTVKTEGAVNASVRPGVSLHGRAAVPYGAGNMPIATKDKLGVVKVGDNLLVDEDGKIYLDTTNIRSIEKAEQTKASEEDGGENVFTISLSEGTERTIVVKNGKAGSPGKEGPQGPPGESITHEWDGSTLIVRSASGESSQYLRGPAGPVGPRGADGFIGRDGRSAYEAAKDAGYAGTEEEFGQMLAAGGKIAHRDEIYYATEGQTVFPIAMENFNPASDHVTVISGRTNLSPGLDYTFDGNNLVLTEGVPAGRNITIRIMKSCAVDRLDESIPGTQIAKESIPLDRLEEMPMSGINANLLDNWYFGNPVNQRGKTEYIGAGYAIDRWHVNGPKSTLKIENDSIIISGEVQWDTAFRQYFSLERYSALVGKKATLSILCDDVIGDFVMEVYAMDDTGSYWVNSCHISVGLNTVCFEVPDAEKLDLRVLLNETATCSVKLKAAKLELGDKQTLAHQDEDGNWVLNEIPNYAEQMAICKQYDSVTGEYIGFASTQIGVVSNPNLLDNWYFLDPINQRGGFVVPPNTEYLQTGTSTVVGETTTYYPVDYINSDGAAIFTLHGTQYYCDGTLVVRGYASHGYTIDRWLKPSSTSYIKLTDEGLLFSNLNGTGEGDTYVLQYLDDAYSYIGKTLTMSAIFDSIGTTGQGVSIDIVCYTSSNYSTFESFSSGRVYTAGLVSCTFTVPVNTAAVELRIVACDWGATNEIVVSATKLELGSQQTLARQENGVWVLNDSPPNKQQELAKCQRYQVKFCGDANSYQALGIGYASSTENLRCTLILPVPLRAKPSISLINGASFESFAIRGEGVSKSVKNISALTTSGVTNEVTVNVATTGLTANNAYLLATNGERGFILDANL